MNKNDKKYESRHRPGTQVTLGQWLAELMCERKAQKDGGKELPRRFWIEKYKEKESYQVWQPYLKLQLISAYRLLRKHGEDKVLQFVRSKNNIFSLAPKWVDDAINNFVLPKIQKPDNDDTPKVFIDNPSFRTGETIKKKTLHDKFE